MSFFTTNNNTAGVISNLAPPAWNSITRFDDKLSFMVNIFFVFFCCFTAAYIKSNATICATPITFLNEETWNEIDTCWPRDKIRDGGEYLHDLFSSKSFHICAKKPQDKWVDRTFPKSKGKFFMEKSFCHRNNRENATDFQSWSWTCKTRNEWLFRSYCKLAVTDGHGLKWCIKMEKFFVLIYLSPCFIKFEVIRLCIFWVVMQITWVVWKLMAPCIMLISILEVCKFFVWSYRKNVVAITHWCNFRQQRSVLTQF